MYQPAFLVAHFPICIESPAMALHLKAYRNSMYSGQMQRTRCLDFTQYVTASISQCHVLSALIYIIS